MSDDIQYHVTLRHPVHVKVQDDSIRVGAFDAIEVPLDDHKTSASAFRTNALYCADLRTRVGGTVGGVQTSCHIWTMSVVLIIPADNIAGIVAQPFRKGR